MAHNWLPAARRRINAAQGFPQSEPRRKHRLKWFTRPGQEKTLPLIESTINVLQWQSN